MIYFIASGHDGPIKIGVANDPEQRRNDLQTGNPNQLFLLHVQEGGSSLERAYHEVFAAHRIKGEWFERVPVVAHLESVCGVTVPKTSFGMVWPWAGDCCPECGDTSVVTEPSAEVSQERGWVELLYVCENHHQWVCGWSVSVAKNGVSVCPSLPRTHNPRERQRSRDSRDPYEERILEIIKCAGEKGIARHGIRKKLGSNAIPSKRIGACLDGIKASGLVHVHIDRSGPGRNSEIWVHSQSASNELLTSAA